MTTGLEGLVISGWVTKTLTSDAPLTALLGGADLTPLRVVEGVLPEDQPTRHPVTGGPLPWITFTILEPQDVGVVGMVTITTLVEFQVRVTTPGASYGPAAPVYTRVHSLLHAKANQVTLAGTIATCERLTGIQFPERANGQDYRHLGGLFRAYVE
jgi:hypothetical protein